MKKICNIAILSMILFFFGCHAQHDYMIYTSNKAKIENQTGQNISLAVCSKHYSFSQQKVNKSVVEISADLNSEIHLIPDSRHEIRYDSTGGFDYQNSDDVNYIDFSLENSSFGLVKLCQIVETKTNLIINKNDNCPIQSIEQRSPANCKEASIYKY